VTQVAEQIDPQFPPLYRFIGAIVLFILLAAVGILVYRPKKSPEQPPVAPPPSRKPTSSQSPPVNRPAPQVNKFKPVSPEAKQVVKKPESVRSKEPVIFTYPAVVGGGIFGDTYIEVTDDKIVRIRSLVVDPEYMK
jgi:hypothetical protein